MRDDQAKSRVRIRVDVSKGVSVTREEIRRQFAEQGADCVLWENPARGSVVIVHSGKLPLPDHEVYSRIKVMNPTGVEYFPISADWLLRRVAVARRLETVYRWLLNSIAMAGFFVAQEFWIGVAAWFVTLCVGTAIDLLVIKPGLGDE